MGLLKHLRSRSKVDNDYHQTNSSNGHSSNVQQYWTGRDCTQNVPERVLYLIFGYICPHTLDESYVVSEQSAVGDGCMLCDLRDLANCARVKRGWYQVAQKQLYRSIRIDAVHFCELEERLAEKRRRRSRHNNPLDPAAARLQLLARTCWDSSWLGSHVEILKLAYMTRESQKADIARCASVMPNLRYIDLPDGFFSGETSCHTLRQELQARCRELRRMKYYAGSEASFEMLLGGHWAALNDLELTRLQAPAQTIRRVLGSLPALRHLTFSEMPEFNDTILHNAPGLPHFPALQRLTVRHCSGLTAQGLVDYVQLSRLHASLSSLTLTSTGVTVPDLHDILQAATRLTHLSIDETVTTSLPLDPIPELASKSLRVLHFELVSGNSTSSHHTPVLPGRSPNLGNLHPANLTEGHYAYLSRSLASNSLPSLREVYVRDPSFCDTLLHPLPAPGFAASSTLSPASFRPTLPLAVYSKGIDEYDWVYTVIEPCPTTSPSSPPQQSAGPFLNADVRASGLGVTAFGGRPVSQYVASQGLGPQWGGRERESVVVGNGFGGFLAVPSEEGVGGLRPGSRGSFGAGDGGRVRSALGLPVAATDKRGSRGDLWR